MSDRKQAIEWPPQWASEDLFGRITDLALRGAEECPPRAWWALRYLKDCVPPAEPETDPAYHVLKAKYRAEQRAMREG
jgi:hypothetical protein